MKTGIQKANTISKLILALTDDDFEQLEEMYNNQLNYFSPLKMATQNKQHALGEHNKSVVNGLKQLRETIKNIDLIALKKVGKI